MYSPCYCLDEFYQFYSLWFSLWHYIQLEVIFRCCMLLSQTQVAWFPFTSMWAYPLGWSITALSLLIGCVNSCRPYRHYVLNQVHLSPWYTCVSQDNMTSILTVHYRMTCVRKRSCYMTFVDVMVRAADKDLIGFLVHMCFFHDVI